MTMNFAGFWEAHRRAEARKKAVVSAAENASRLFQRPQGMLLVCKTAVTTDTEVWENLNSLPMALQHGRKRDYGIP